MVGTIHVPVNAKRNLAIEFAVIEARLRAQERGLSVCAWCDGAAIETLRFWHPYIPAAGICGSCLAEWKRTQLLDLSGPGRRIEGC